MVGNLNLAFETSDELITNYFADEFIFPMTIHPDVSGRPHVLLMHERIIEHINKHEGVRWVTMAEVMVHPMHFHQRRILKLRV